VPQWLERHRHQGRRDQGWPEATGPAAHRGADRHDQGDVAGRRQRGGQGHHDCPVDDEVDLQQAVSKHCDRHAERDGQLREAQRQPRQPRSLLPLDARDHEDDHDADRQEHGRGRYPQQLAPFVVPRPSKA
jgi:hypothetical protein